MRELPRREGVGREALVHEAERRLGEGIPEVGIETLDLVGEQQALVDHGARRERRHVELRQARQFVLLLELGQRVLGLLADGEDLALEGVLVGDLGAAADDRHLHHRHALDHAAAETGRVGRHVAPADQPLLLDLDEMLEPLDRKVARLVVLRQEAHRHRVVAGRRQVDAGLLRPVAQQRVGRLDHAAGAVADQRIGADGAAMVEVDQDLQALADDVMRLAALDVGHEADAARVVLVARVVQSLLLGQIGHMRHAAPAGATSPLKLSLSWSFSPASRSGQKPIVAGRAALYPAARYAQEVE